jgi:hypothetical protein
LTPVGFLQHFGRQILFQFIDRKTLQGLAQQAKFLQQLPGLGTLGQQALDLRLLLGGQFTVQIGAEKFFRQILHGTSGSWETNRLPQKKTQFTPMEE